MFAAIAQGRAESRPGGTITRFAADRWRAARQDRRAFLGLAGTRAMQGHRRSRSRRQARPLLRRDNRHAWLFLVRRAFGHRSAAEAEIYCGGGVTVRILKGDCREVLRSLPDESVHCVVTSPPYFGLRDYGVSGQIGLEESPEAFITEMVEVFRDVRRVLRADGTLWLNLGDSYAA